jgi:hypothetical protein
VCAVKVSVPPSVLDKLAIPVVVAMRLLLSPPVWTHMTSRHDHELILGEPHDWSGSEKRQRETDTVTLVSVEPLLRQHRSSVLRTIATVRTDFRAAWDRALGCAVSCWRWACQQSAPQFVGVGRDAARSEAESRRTMTVATGGAF